MCLACWLAGRELGTSREASPAVVAFPSLFTLLLLSPPQKEAKDFLEREWNAQYWKRNTTLTQEEYYVDEENWDRAVEHGWDVVNEERGFKKEVEVEEEEDDDEYDEDDEDDEEGVTADGDKGKVEKTDEPEGGTDVAGKEGAAGKSKKKATKTETDVAQVTNEKYRIF